ncbi:unnamed protein product [Pedinophyceae sp. YPF-701]|nr:unnamed protein product [Pedinophyceae sp. YPF-701]
MDMGILGGQGWWMARAVHGSAALAKHAHVAGTHSFGWKRKDRKHKPWMGDPRQYNARKYGKLDTHAKWQKYVRSRDEHLERIKERLDEHVVATCKARGLRISHKKLNAPCTMIRGLHVDDALVQLAATPKKAAQMLHTAVLSAKANAVNNHGLKPWKLFVYRADVGRATPLKRIRLHGRGKFGRMERYRAHLRVVLKEGNTRPVTKVLPPMLLRERLAREEGEGDEGGEAEGGEEGEAPGDVTPAHVQKRKPVQPRRAVVW